MLSARRQWRTLECDAAAASRLAGALSLPLPLARVLAARGLADPPDADRFLQPRLGAVCDPLAMDGMERAARRVLDAVRRRERIAVFGDYDCDGVTSCALLVRVLRALGADAAPFLPSRLEDGYGFTAGAAARCVEECRPALIVTVDCGITAVEAVRAAAGGGVDVIVTDHHEPGPELPPAFAVVNPKLAAAPEGRELAGVGLAFKLCHAMLKLARPEGLPGADFDLRTVLDLVAIGTVADVAALTGENRILVKHGLDRLRTTSSLGLRALMAVAGLDGDVDTHHLGFVIGPRLNAVGRMGSADEALRLLLTDDADEALAMARILDAANVERRRVENETRAQAEAEIDGWFKAGEHFGLVVGREGWHPGTVGIVASRLCSRYARPAVVIAFDGDGKGRGSCRSVERVDILGRLQACAPLLESFGGHKAAAGLEIRKERLAAFAEQFNAACACVLRDTDLRPVQTVDAWIHLREADDRLLDALRRVKPTGTGNPAPVWGLRGVKVAGETRRVGKESKHLQLTLESEGARMRAVAFNMGHLNLAAGVELDVLAHLEENAYGGRCTPQLNIQDVASAGSRAAGQGSANR